MTTLSAIMLTDTKTANRKSAVQRLRSSLAAGRRPARRTADARRTRMLLHDVAQGGTAATAANRYLKTLATGRRG
jgi:hypothetical protein